MELKLMLLKCRVAILESRGPHNHAIVNHIKRRIRAIENKMAAQI